MFFVIGPLWFVVVASLLWWLCQPRQPKVYRIIRPRYYKRARIVRNVRR